MDNKSKQFQETSKIISFLRFPLCFGVILIHTHLVGKDGIDQMFNSNFPLYSNLAYFISFILTGTAVPLFFIFSGLLFFHNVSFLNKSIYTQKLNKRIKSLLIPYIIWNLITFIIYGITLKVNPNLFNGICLIPQFNIKNFLLAFWNAGGTGNPICGPLWFIRDLIITIIFTPIIFYISKKFKYIGLLTFTTIYIMDIWKQIPGINCTAFYFFYLGAFFSIHHIYLVQFCKKILGGSFLLFTITSIYLLIKKNDFTEIIHLNILSGLFFVVYLTHRILKYKNIEFSKTINSSTFFIFASHYFPIIALCKICMNLLSPNSDLELIIIYILCPISVTYLCYLSFSLLLKHCPNIAHYLSGGRS